MSTFEIANNLAAIAPGTWPRTDYFIRPDYGVVPATFDTAPVTGSPVSTISGVALPADTITGLIGVDLREDVRRRTVRISLAAFDPTSEYTIDVDALGAVSTTSQPYANVPAALAAIKAEIDAAFSAVVTTSITDQDDDGDVDTLALLGVDEADFAVTTLSASVGSNVIDVRADSTSLDFELFVLRGGADSTAYPRPDTWRQPPLPGGGPTLPVGLKGYEERYLLSGQRRVYMGVSSLTGAPGEVVVGGSVQSVTYTYKASVGYGVTPGSS